MDRSDGHESSAYVGHLGGCGQGVIASDALEICVPCVSFARERDAPLVDGPCVWMDCIGGAWCSVGETPFALLAAIKRQIPTGGMESPVESYLVSVVGQLA